MNMGILIPIIGIICGVGLAIWVRAYEHKEKMAMLEKGITPGPDYFKHRRRHRLAPIRLAATAIGVGIGLFIANYLELQVGMDDDVVYPAMILIFGGIGLTIGTFYVKRAEDKEKENEG